MLNIRNNSIGDAGLTALASALGSGALASIESLVVEHPEHLALETACEVRGIGVY